MTTASYRLKLTRVNSLKLKVATRIPAELAATSPIVLTRAGGIYTFSFDASSLSGVYQPLDATLTALAALNSTAGMLAQTGSDTFTKRTLTGTANEITVTAGDGVGVPTWSLPTALTFTGKTVTGGTLSGTAINGATILTSTYNKVTITAPATSATLTLVDGTTLTGPAASGTAMTLGNVETVTGVKTFGSAGAVGKLAVAGTTSGSTILNATAIASGTLTLPAATDTLVGKATTDILTNKTYDTAGAGNSFSINSVAVTANTGTGAVARAAGPTFTTPALGIATGTSLALNGATIGTNDLALTGTSLFGNDLTVSKNQNATTTFTLSNTDTTNTNSRTQFTFTGGTVGARFLAISGNSFVIGTTTAHPISFQSGGASAMVLDANSGQLSGAVGTSIPVTKTGASSSMGVQDSSLIINNAGTHTLTLQNPSGTNAGRWLTIKTVTANAVISASSNVVPRITAAAGTAILPATSGAWASLQSDGTNWIIMSGTP